jgi:hypothetical protein
MKRKKRMFCGGEIKKSGRLSGRPPDVFAWYYDSTPGDVFPDLLVQGRQLEIIDIPYGRIDGLLHALIEVLGALPVPGRGTVSADHSCRILDALINNRNIGRVIQVEVGVTDCFAGFFGKGGACNTQQRHGQSHCYDVFSE